jgi:hypothetical protein
METMTMIRATRSFGTRRISTITVAMCMLAAMVHAADQTIPGAGNDVAAQLSGNSPMVQSAYEALVQHVRDIHDAALRTTTLDAITNRWTCVQHRAGVTEAMKTAILAQLTSAGLVNMADNATFPGGLRAGVFPPLLDDASACPHLPQPFTAAPGSVFGGHHSYPGGLPIHESFNLESSLALTNGYRLVYGHSFPGRHGLPVENPDYVFGNDPVPAAHDSDIEISQDIMIGAPVWHDWGKPMVFQWNADGTEFAELNFGGAGSVDNYGAAGDSRTGGHHILGVAETMVRGLSPEFVITQASAHSNPTSGNEYKVVNWIRAAAIIARIDPVAKGYLYLDSHNQLRLPPVRQTGSINLPVAAPGQPYILAEYELHNLSDADFTLTGPAISDVEAVLKVLAPAFQINPASPDYNIKFRNPVFSHLTGERLLILYTSGGVPAVQREVANLRARGII